MNIFQQNIYYKKLFSDTAYYKQEVVIQKYYTEVIK